MPSMNVDLRKEFLAYLNQPDLCELFYIYMKSDDLSYVLEFYLACDGLKNQFINKPSTLIKIIYKHYLSTNKPLSSSKKFSLPNHLLSSIKQRLIKQEFHTKFYDQAQEYVLKYMLQMCYPKFLVEQQNSSSIHRRKKKQSINSLKYNVAQRNPREFFEEIKTRLLIHQTNTPIIEDDDPSAILDLQIAKTINDDSGVGNDFFVESFHPQKLIDVIWYPSLDSTHALLSTIPLIHNHLTLKEFRQLFIKQSSSFRYFFKTTCTPDINKEQYVFRELTMDNELIPFYNGKIFVQLDRIC